MGQNPVLLDKTNNALRLTSEDTKKTSSNVYEVVEFISGVDFEVEVIGGEI